ncbi:MFS transporter [Sulfobacillus thermosulfidooxidans]|uniref:MFS transporter n=1 Tax=Sulfobacillus thermosulfidooxidans TaxID=28034 RepID=UPI0006B697E4|nr:MFS transporter [Sulfobacillus thermosulfidooxidans]
MNFVTFIGSEFISSIGNGAYRVALNWTLVTRYGTVRALAIVQFLSLLFGAIVQMRSGALIDRYDGRRVLVVTNLVLAGIAGLLAFDVMMRPSAFSTGFALVFVVLIGAVIATVEPAFFSVVMRVRGKPDIDTANSWILGSYALSGIIGPVIGGVLIARHGFWLGFAADAVSFLGAAGLMALVGLNPPVFDDNAVKTDEHAPWRWTWRTATVRRIFTVEAFGNLVVTTFLIGIPFIAKDTDRAGGAIGLGIFYAAFYGGVFVSSALIPRVAQKLPRGVVAYVIPYAVVLGMLVTFYGHTWIFLLGGIFLAGFGLPGIDILTRAAILETVPEGLLGRITAVGSVVTTVSQLLAMVVVMMVNAFHSVWVIFAVAWLTVSTSLLFTRKTLPSGSAAF